MKTKDVKAIHALEEMLDEKFDRDMTKHLQKKDGKINSKTEDKKSIDGK
jgi:predicted DNA-binding protein